MCNASCIASKNILCICQNLNRRHEVHKNTKLGMRNESVDSKLAYIWLVYIPTSSFIQSIMHSSLVCVSSRQDSFFIRKATRSVPKR